MFSRGRPCLRRRGLSALLDTVAAGPDEPLLFLYPCWAASVLRQRRPIAFLYAAAAGKKNRSTPDFLARRARGSYSPPSFCRQSRQWVSSNAAVQSPVASTAEQPSTKKKEKLDGQEGGDVIPVQSQPATTQKHRPIGRPARRLERIRLRRAPPQPLDTSIRLPLREDAETTKLSVRDRRKLRYRQFLRTMGSWAGEWSDMKALLKRMQRRIGRIGKKTGKKKEMYVPEETIALFSGIIDTAMKENIWYLHLHHGCRVHVLNPKDGDGAHRKVILSGSEHVNEMVAERILSAQRSQASGDPLVSVCKPPAPVFASVVAAQRNNIPVPVLRGVWDFSRAAKKGMTLDEVLAARPTLNSVKELTEHVEDLTNAKVPSARHRAKDRSSVPPPREQTARHIVALFRQPANQRYLSTAALNRALIFLCENEFLSDSRALFVGAENFATVDTYNILLRSAARRQDVQAFRGFLGSMSRARIRPNSETWLALLAALVTPSDKADLMSHMVRMGYMKDISTLRSALQLTIQDSLLVHLESGKSIDSFVDLMVNTYGSNWFSPSLLGQMFSVTARLKDFDAMDQLLQICTEHCLAADSSSLNQIVRMCRADIFLALRYTFRFMDRPSFRLCRDTFERLFLVAFKGRQYNICRVLWRYACMRGNVTPKMKQAVLTTLCRNVSVKKGADDISNLWRINAGKVIVGLDLHHEKYSIQESVLEDLPPEFRHSPLLYLSTGFKPEGEDRDRQIRLAAALVRRDIELGADHYKPLYELPMMLDAAAIMDRDWYGKPRPLTWMLQNAILVPVQPAS